MLIPGFVDQFREQSLSHLKPIMDGKDIAEILDEFRRLRTTDSTIYLRNSSINLVNGMIGMTFSCDGAHYIDHKTFFEKLETFGTPNSEATLASCQK